MKKLLLTAFAVSSIGLFGLSLRAADDMSHSMSGVLIDNACGGKAEMKTEADAAKHPISCAKKPGCASSGYQLVVGDKHYKLDDKGNEEAKTYLDKAETTHVTVEGSMDGDTMKVTSIKAAEEKK
jgi:hypothetical protein